MGWQEFDLQTRDGIRLYAQEWSPESHPAGVVCLVHGLGEHSGRYTHLADFLNRNGYTLIAFDLRGHGKSPGIRGHTPSFEAYMQDIDGILEEARKRHPQLPLFLYGHSLGGMLVLNYALRRKPQLSGVIATGPGLRTALEEQPLKIAFAKIMGSVFPALCLPSGLDVDLLSRDPEVVRRYKSDPFVHEMASLGFARHSLKAIDWVFAHAAEFNLPLLIMHGAADQIAYCKGSQEFASRVLAPHTLKIWNGLYHEIHNEPEQGEVFKELLGWLETQRNLSVQA